GYSSSRNSVLWAFSSLVVQHDQAARIARIQAASTGGIRPCLRRVAGCATPTGSAGHASATASLKLTFHLDHSVRANQIIFDCFLTQNFGFDIVKQWQSDPYHYTFPVAISEDLIKEFLAKYGLICVGR